MDPNSTTKACCASLNKKLTKLSAGAESECTIYRVHKHLRNVNPNAYEPEVIAIGPYHRNKDHLKMMEDYKLRYFQHLIRRKPSNSVESYAACVGRLEAEARKCYADEPTSLSPSDFIQMLVLDGCFILELLLKCFVVSLREENDPIFQMDWMIMSLKRDLMLFENQLPFFVLCELFDLIEAPGQHSRLRDLLLRFFKNLYHGRGYRGQASVGPREVKHLLHFIHRSWLPGGTGTEKKDKDKWLPFIKSARRLKEANVRFKISEPEAALFDVRFENGVMIMAPLWVEDKTESVLRNLVAYEQYFGQDQENFVTDYVMLLDCLIDSSKDVEILSRDGIVKNWMGDEEAVAKMVNKLAESVVVPFTGFIYAEMFENVEKHCRKRRNRWMATLRRNYLSSPWVIMSLIVGAVLLLLTFTQTVFTILQVV